MKSMTFGGRWLIGMSALGSATLALVGTGCGTALNSASPMTGYSSTREIQSATFAFTPATGAALAEKTITVPVSTLFETWYTTAESAQYGSAFTYTQLFTLSGPATAVGGVGVTLTNTIGTSNEVTSP